MAHGPQYDESIRDGSHTHYQRVRNAALNLTPEERHRLFIELSHEYEFEHYCYMARCCVCDIRSVGDRNFHCCVIAEECENYICDDCLDYELGEVGYVCPYHRNPTLKFMALMHIKYEQ